MSYGGKIFDLIEKLEGNPGMTDEEFLDSVEQHFDQELRTEVEQIMQERDLVTRDTAVYQALTEK